MHRRTDGRTDGWTDGSVPVWQKVEHGEERGRRGRRVVCAASLRSLGVVLFRWEGEARCASPLPRPPKDNGNDDASATNPRPTGGNGGMRRVGWQNQDPGSGETTAASGGFAPSFSGWDVLGDTTTTETTPCRCRRCRRRQKKRRRRRRREEDDATGRFAGYLLGGRIWRRMMAQQCRRRSSSVVRRPPDSLLILLLLLLLLR